MPASKAQQLLEQFSRGMVTGHEMVIRLAQLANDTPPAEFAADIPDEFLHELRELSANPPDPGGRIVGSVCAGGDFDWDRHMRDQFDRYREGLLRWRDYFTRIGDD